MASFKEVLRIERQESLPRQVPTTPPARVSFGGKEIRGLLYFGATVTLLRKDALKCISGCLDIINYVLLVLD